MSFLSSLLCCLTAFLNLHFVFDLSDCLSVAKPARLTMVMSSIPRLPTCYQTCLPLYLDCLPVTEPPCHFHLICLFVANSACPTTPVAYGNPTCSFYQLLCLSFGPVFIAAAWSTLKSARFIITPVERPMQFIPVQVQPQASGPSTFTLRSRVWNSYKQCPLSTTFHFQGSQSQNGMKGHL